jgi:hypothetical protein
MNRRHPHAKQVLWIVLGLALILAALFAPGYPDPEALPDLLEPPPAATILSDDLAVDGYYNTPEAVAAYLRHFDRLPDHYRTKREASELGWVSEDGNLWDVTNQGSIGGDRFGNREGLLPDAPGRVWYECDVNDQGGYRGAERLVYSSDGLIYYTDDHYASFIRLENPQQ